MVKHCVRVSRGRQFIHLNSTPLEKKMASDDPTCLEMSCPMNEDRGPISCLLDSEVWNLDSEGYVSGTYDGDWAQKFFGGLQKEWDRGIHDDFFELLYTHHDLDTCYNQMAWKIVCMLTKDKNGQPVFDPYEPLNFNDAHELY